MTVPTRADVEAAAYRLGAAIRRTPVLEVDLREHGVNADVVLKLELTQHTGSFITFVAGGGYVEHDYVAAYLDHDAALTAALKLR